MEIEEYFAALASASPTPGGGSAATLVIAASASLVAMVARITALSPKHAEQHALAQTLADKADSVCNRALTARNVDERAYERVVAASSLPKSTAAERDERTSQLQAALAGAAAAPLGAAELGKLAAILVARALDFEHAGLASDLGCAAEFAGAGLAAAALNVRVNHRFMKDLAVVDAQERVLAGYERETAPLLKRARFEVGRLLAR